MFFIKVVFFNMNSNEEHDIEVAAYEHLKDSNSLEMAFTNRNLNDDLPRIKSFRRVQLISYLRRLRNQR